MSKPRIYYLTVFPSKGVGAYRSRTWWEGDSGNERAEKFVKHVKEKYNINGKIIKVREVK